MSAVQTILKNKQFRAAVAVCAVLGIAALVVAWKSGIDLKTIKASWLLLETWLKANPWAMFLALLVLPGLPVPMTLLLTLTGVIWGANLNACLLMLLALAMNMTWTYFIAAYPARNLIEKVLKNTSIKIPDLPRQDHLRLILILRLTPGIPMFIHNYILGFLRTPFWLYLPLSLLLSGGMCTGILLTSGALVQGKAGAAIAGISLIVVAIVVTKLLRGRMAKKGDPKAHPHLTDPPANLADISDKPDPASDI